MGPGAQMHTLAHLGARSNQGVRVDHGALAHVSPDVDERRGHDDHVLGQEGAGPDRGTTRHETDVLLDAPGFTQRQRVLIEKRSRSGRKLADPANAERQKDTGFDPLDGLPFVAHSPRRAHDAPCEGVHEGGDGGFRLIRNRGLPVLEAAQDLGLEFLQVFLVTRPRSGHVAPSASNRPALMRALRRKVSTSADGRTSGRR